MRAFTLVEVLIVLSLMGMLAGMSAIAGNESYQRALASGDTGRIVSLLYRARALSLGNVCMLPPCDQPKSHGVRIDRNGISLVEDTEGIESYPLNAAASPVQIFFLPNSGGSSGGVIQIDSAPEHTISVRESGAISFD